MVTAKDFAMDKIARIENISYDLNRINDKELIRYGIEIINKLAKGLEEHLEYLEVKENKE